MIKNNITDKVENFVINSAYIFIAFALASLFSWFVKLPVKNYDNISNLYVSAGYSPEENFLKILFIILFSIFFYYGIKKLSKHDKFFRFFIITILVFGIFSIVLMPKIMNYVGHIDTFHHGEQLSPANAFINGKKLYTDLFVLHGAGDDVLIPAIGLKLPFSNPNGGIGSYFFIVTTLQLLSSFLFFYLISKIFRNKTAWLLVSLWFLLSYFSDFYYIRDIFVWLTVLVLFRLITGNVRKLTYPLLFILGFIGSASYFYAIDRGYISSFLVFLFVLSLLFTKNVSGKIKIGLNLSKVKFKQILFIAFGAIVAQLIAFIYLGISGYLEFIKTTLITIPKYLGLMFNFPVPELTSKTFLTWLPIFVAVIASIMLINLFRIIYIKEKKIDKSILFAAIIFITSIIFLRTGYGRPDFGHIAYATPLLFLSAFYLSYLSLRNIKFKNINLLWPVALFFVLLLWPVSTVSVDRIAAFSNMKIGYIKKYLQLPRNANKDLVQLDVQNVANYIKENSTKEDPLFVFTQQPIFYYLTNRENPSRFYITWFADPQNLTNELLNSLKAKPPKFIVYSSGTGWDNPDGFYSSDRSPEIDLWIKENYKTTHQIDSFTILER